MDSIRKCKFTDPNTNQEKEVTMSEYVDMVPRGAALGPVVSRKLRESGFDVRGLIPGVLEDIMAINPGAIFNSAKEKNDARCILVRGLVNKKQADGSLDPTARQPDLQYLPEGGVLGGEFIKIFKKKIVMMVFFFTVCYLFEIR
jgi:hypothetical protein